MLCVTRYEPVVDPAEIRLLRRIVQAERMIKDLSRRVARLEERKYGGPVQVAEGDAPPVVFKEPVRKSSHQET